MNTQSQSGSYLTFKLDGEFFAIPVGHVIEIIEVTQITKIPQTSEYIRGVTNLRGSVLPVIETRTKFGLDQIQDTIDTCIIVLTVMYEKEEIQLGIVVDQVVEVSEFDYTQIKPKPSIGRKYSNEYITGIAHSDDAFVLILNINKVFSTEEIIQVSEVAATEEEIEESLTV